MKLLTKEILNRLPKMGATEHQDDPVIQAKFFTPWTNWTWFAIEYEPEQELFFGYVKGFENELGYFSLAELESLQGPLGLRIERDIHFEPTPLSQIKASSLI